jgi:peroxiredoxin
MLRAAVGFLTLAAVFAGHAQDKPGPTPAERLKALVADHEAARQAFLKATNDGDALKTPKEVYEKARVAAKQEAERCAAGCLELAEKHPAAPAALDALLWVLRNRVTGAPAVPENARLVRDHGRALSLLRRDHLGSERLAAVCQVRGMHVMPGGVSFLEEVLAKSPHRSVRGPALASLADYKFSFASGLCATLRAEPDKAKRMERVWGKEVLQAVLAADPDRMRQEGERLYERLAKEYADVPDAQAGTLGKRAALALEALRQPPAASRPAPRIEGRDMDGKKFKLSDYRGKVVLLVFTGDWCAACNAFHPQQRSLAKAFAGRPLALVDVNLDVDLDRRKKINAKEGITWRAFQETVSWHENLLGPIAMRWGIDSWPTLFLIDHKGIIRKKYVATPGEKVLSRELGRLVEEAEAERKE